MKYSDRLDVYARRAKVIRIAYERLRSDVLNEFPADVNLVEQTRGIAIKAVALEESLIVKANKARKKEKKKEGASEEIWTKPADI